MSKRRPSENTGLEEKIEKDFPYKKFPGEPHALIKKSDRLLKTCIDKNSIIDFFLISFFFS